MSTQLESGEAAKSETGQAIQPAGAHQARILVVFDGTPAALEDVRRAGFIADQLGAILEIVSAPALNRWALAFALGGGLETVSVEEEASRELHRQLSETIDEIPIRVPIETRSIKEGAARFIRRVAGGSAYDVIVHRGNRAGGTPA
jgi:hypothetical protein